MIVNTNLSGGGRINGIIEQYKVAAGEQVGAGDFVRFTSHSGIDTQLSSMNSAGKTVSAVAIDATHVFVAHSYGYTSGENAYYLYGAVVTIDGESISIGPDTQLSADTKSGEYISAVLLDSGKVFIAHSNGRNNSVFPALYAMVVTINGTTITAGTDTFLDSSGGNISAVALDSGRAFIAHNSSYLDGRIVSINGTSISEISHKRLDNSNNGAYNANAILLNRDKVLVLWSLSQRAYRICGMVVCINDADITIGQEEELIANDNAGRTMSATRLDSRRVFIAHYNGRTDSGGNCLYGTVVSIDGTQITLGADVQLSSINYSAQHIGAATIDSNRVFIAHAYSTNYLLYGMTVTIDGTAILKFSDTQINDTQYGAYIAIDVTLCDERLLIVHGRDTATKLFGVTCDLSMLSPAASYDIIGVAKNRGQGGDIIDVYRPETT